MFSVRPLTSRLAARLRQKRSIWSDAFPSEQISPGSWLDHPASIALDDEYERILDTPPETTIADEVRVSRGGRLKHPPTISYNIGPALIADGTIYYPGGYESTDPRGGKLTIHGQPASLMRAQLCNSVLTERYFGHWLLDTPALMLLAEQRRLPAIAALTSAKSEHRVGYTSLLDVALQDIHLARVEQLWVVDDRPTNAGRASRLNDIRRKVRAGRGGGPKRVAIHRGLSGVRRNLANHAELWGMLAAEAGFEVVDPLELNHEQLIGKLASAEIVVGVEGSTLCHAVVSAAPGAVIFAIMPPTRFCMAVKIYTDMLGMKFGFIVGEGTGSDFFVDVNRMRKALPLILASTP